MAAMWTYKKRQRDYGYDLCISSSDKKIHFNHDGSESTHCSSRKEGISGDAKIVLDRDPDYKRFLGHLKADKKSYTYEMKKEDGKSLCIKYEIWDESSLNDTDKGRIPVRNDSSRENLGSMPNGEIELESSPVNDRYKEFLRKHRHNDESMIFEYNDHLVRYESDNESEIVSEVEPECAPYRSCRKKFQRSFGSSMDEDDYICIESLGASSQHQEELMSLLRKPYSEREYRDLANLVCINKPLVKTRELQGRHLVSYQTNKISLSYLDHFDGKRAVAPQALAMDM